MNEKYKNYFQSYLSTLPESESAEIKGAEPIDFCNDEYNTNECARLVAEGIKRATCIVKEIYKIEGEDLPQVGQYHVVIDWNKEPVCVIRVTDVSFCPFGQVSREFAESEGEGDGTYEWWYKAHYDYFSGDCISTYGLEFNDSTDLVLVSFELVYK